MPYIVATHKSVCNTCKRKVAVNDKIWWEKGKLIVCPKCHDEGKVGKDQDGKTDAFKMAKKHNAMLRNSKSLKVTADWETMGPASVSKREEPPLHPKVKFPFE